MMTLRMEQIGRKKEKGRKPKPRLRKCPFIRTLAFTYMPALLHLAFVMIMVRNWPSADISRYLITLASGGTFIFFLLFPDPQVVCHNHIPILYFLLILIPHLFLFSILLSFF